MKKVVIPCSGIGKAFGQVAREATYLLTDSEHPDKFKTICLPLLMADDEESKQIVLESDVYTIDGCPKKCASVLVKHVGGTPVMELLTAKVLAKNREHKPESILDIGEGGKFLTEDIARIILDHGGAK
ncbi:MAG: putative zinc-binding protein [Candidatus Thorarchaeota archaeon]